MKTANKSKDLDKVEDFDIGTIPYAQSYVLKIRHAYPITQFYRTAENFKDKLREYADFGIDNIEYDAETRTFTMEIKGELPKVVTSRRISITKLR